VNRSNGALVSAWWPRISAAVLCLAVTVIHIMDQGGFPGSKTPRYVGVGYYLLEIAGVLAAVLLASRAVRAGWVLALGVAAGPLVGYILSRGPGLPDYTYGKGHWISPLGIASLVVEGALLVLAVTVFLAGRRGESAMRCGGAQERDHRGDFTCVSGPGVGARERS
jgi:hypothetical protein